MIKVKRNLNWSDINMAELDLVKLITHFAHSNKAEGKSPKTVSWYSEMLLNFVSFLKLVGRDATLAEFNPTNVREFIIHEQGRAISPYTVQAKVRALKAFSSWLFAEGYTPDNLLAIIKLPKVPIKLVETLNSDEIEALISVQNQLTSIGTRNTAILVTLLDTGLRCSELSNLRFEDTHIEEGQYKFTIGGKAVYALWGTGPLPPEINGEVNLTEISGASRVTDSATLKLSDSPVFIELTTGTIEGD